METSQPIRGRFAPSPSGRMHLGNLFAALLAWLDVRAQGGELLLRLEDLDPDRCRPLYAQQLVEDLRWLGLTWDLGWPEGGNLFSQRCRQAIYQRAFDQLNNAGLLYPCYCTRKERAVVRAPHAADSQEAAPCRCVTLSHTERAQREAQGRRPAWRIRVPAKTISFTDDNYGPYEEALSSQGGDFILRRSDGAFAYQLAVVVDDGQMGMTRVVRGRDLLASTARQIWLAETLGYPRPTYCHVPLLCHSSGRRLSKRDRDLNVGFLRTHTTPQRVLGYLGWLAGLLDRPEPLTPQELLSTFDWASVGTTDRILDDGFPMELRDGPRL